MTKLDGKTLDLAAENIEQLRQIFPDVFEEGKIDFDKLKQVLGEYMVASYLTNTGEEICFSIISAMSPVSVLDIKNVSVCLYGPKSSTL